MNAVRLVAALAVACLIGPAARADDKDYAKKIVGKWEVTKADEGTIPKGAIVEFTKDGKIHIFEKAGDKEMMFGGTYKLDGDKFMVTIKIGDDEHSNTITITKMTDTEMHTKNEEGKVVELTKK